MDRLPSWREGDANHAILAFVDGVTASGSVAFVPPAARIAVQREYAYAGTSFTDPHAEPIGETAHRLGWTMVSMRRDWSTIFGT